MDNQKTTSLVFSNNKRVIFPDLETSSTGLEIKPRSSAAVKEIWTQRSSWKATKINLLMMLKEQIIDQMIWSY